MSAIVVNPEQLEAASTQLRRIADEWQRTSQRLRGVLGTLDWRVVAARAATEHGEAAARELALLSSRGTEMAGQLTRVAGAFRDLNRMRAESIAQEGLPEQQSYQQFLQVQLAAQKSAWWEANLQGDNAAMAAAHAEAERLRLLGAQDTDAMNAAISETYQPKFELQQLKRDWYTAWLQGDTATMDRVHTSADAIRAGGASDLTTAETQVVLNATLAAALGLHTAAWVRGDQAQVAALQSKIAQLEASGATISAAERDRIVAEAAKAAPAPPADSVDALIAKVFPKPQDQLILQHTMAEEGPGTFGAAWGAVVYTNKYGQTLCDRNWLNFGLISFAFPSGTAGDVFREIFAKPGEVEAFRSMALRCLEDNPGGTVASGWRDLLNDPAGTAIPSASKEQLVDQFIAKMTARDDQAARDWLFKYINEPATKSGVATGVIRDDWKNLFSEFLARPASQEAQLHVMHVQYYSNAVTAAEQFGLTTVRGTGFMFDVMVQQGSPTKEMRALLGTEAYKNAPEIGKLEMLRDTFARGSTSWNRRDSVIHSTTLTDALYQP